MTPIGYVLEVNEMHKSIILIILLMYLKLLLYLLLIHSISNTGSIVMLHKVDTLLVVKGRVNEIPIIEHQNLL
jgi:hypothetical protein